MCCISNKVLKRDSKRFFLLLEGNTKAGYATLNKKWFKPILKRFIKSPYSISRATSADSDCCFIPTAMFSAAKRTHHAPIRFDQQAYNSQGYTSYRNKENGNIDVYGGDSFELVRLAHEPASSLPKPCATLKTPHESCPFAAPCWPS